MVNEASPILQFNTFSKDLITVQQNILLVRW